MSGPFFGGQFLGGGFFKALPQSVVLFPVEPLRFRSRWDKTAYAWAVFVRDMRAPTWRPGRDRLVSAVALAAR
jgi:hypothetical protein